MPDLKPEPVDPTAFFALVDELASTLTADGLVAIVPRLVSFEHGAFMDTLVDLWQHQWLRVTSDPPPANLWPNSSTPPRPAWMPPSVPFTVDPSWVGDAKLPFA